VELKQWVGGYADSPSASATIVATERVGLAGRYAVDIVIGVEAGTGGNIGVAIVRNENQFPDRKFAPIGNTPNTPQMRHPTLYLWLEPEQKIGVFVLATDTGKYSAEIVLHLIEEARP